jgi:hypothetical protein
MLAKGKAPKVFAAKAQGRSRLQTFPRGDRPQGLRNKARKGEGECMAVFVLDKRKKPLMPCSEKRARLLLERGRARVHRLVPFTIRLVDRLQEESALQPVRLKLDPGSKTTGIALVREFEETNAETGEIHKIAHVVFLAELHHRGDAICDALTQRRAFRRRWRANLRYRAKRFNNRRRPEGWLAPSLRHRVETTLSWVGRLRRWVPVTALSLELVRFDTQALQNPEVSGVKYQQGTLFGYEVREYLLEKWGRKCVYESSPFGTLVDVARGRITEIAG